MFFYYLVLAVYFFIQIVQVGWQRLHLIGSLDNLFKNPPVELYDHKPWGTR